MPNLSGRDLAYPSISKFYPDMQIRAFLGPAMSRSADLASVLVQTTSRASQGVGNGYITSKMYILTLNSAVSTVSSNSSPPQRFFDSFRVAMAFF